jgi:Protein of unknown function (DUF3592)
MIRVAMILVGGVFTYVFGGNFIKTLTYRFTGTTVEGKIVGFSSGRYSGTMQEKATGTRNGKRQALRPFFRYPTAEGATDSLTNRSSVSTFSFSTYDMGEPVTVVFSKDNPQDSFIFGFQIVMFQAFVTCFCLFMIWLGIRMKL